MDPKIWGYSLWQSLLHIALVYPDNPRADQKTKYKIFFQSLAHVLPCFACQKNYAMHLHKYPVHLNNRDTLLLWLLKIHNQTRQKQGLDDLTFEQFKNKYSQQKSFNIKILYFFLILSIVLGLYYFLEKPDNLNFLRLR